MTTSTLSLNATIGADPTADGPMLRALQLLIYALVVNHPNPKAVSDTYHGLWDDQLEGLGEEYPPLPHNLEALHAADHLVTMVLDEVIAGALGA